MDSEQVYFTYDFVGDRRVGGEVVTGIEVTPMSAEDEPAAKFFVAFASFRSAGYSPKGYLSQAVEEGAGFTDVYDLERTRGSRVPVKRRYEPLTLENFASIRNHIEGYDLIVKQVKTDAALRAWYREAILG
jgi:hypothetical protein